MMLAYLVMAATVLIGICLVASLTLGIIALVRADDGDQPNMDSGDDVGDDIGDELPDRDDTPSTPTGSPSRVLGATADMGQP